ncbi:hypothetical protein BCR39DRAFT_502348 [Naematelia encephala]|uniref:Uncharacterized protein n=1 Tax=Naematelia encephala TaxID=71784 RepID=A0A1Y2AEI7_9TREE|nr:hypothetical protein BCR39DRAFT_502348 [Naematelia encephala]
MKRESDSSPPSTPPSKSALTPNTTPTPTKRLKSTPSSKTKTKTDNDTEKIDPSPGKGRSTKLTLAAKAEFLEDIIAAGVRAVNMDTLALKYGVPKSVLVDQMKPNRSNLRERAIKAIRGD